MSGQGCSVLVSLASATAIPATAAEVPLHHGPRFVDGQCAAVKLRPVHLADRFLRIFIGHRYKAKALRAAGIAISDDADSFHSTIARKSIRNIVLSSLEREISNKQFF
jgi:hypothetical protein